MTAAVPSDLYWIEETLKEASQSRKDVPVGSLVVKNNEIIGRGYNKREITKDPTAHAEIVALRQAATYLGSWQLRDCTIYSSLEPCPMCAEAIIQSRVSKLVFGAYDKLLGAAGSVYNLFCAERALPVPEVVGGIGEEACEKLLVDFFQKLRQQSKN